MFTRKFIMVAALGLIGSVTYVASATPPSRECELITYRASAVRPYLVDVQQGRNSGKKLVGANVYVPAQQGLSAEYLQAQVQSHIAAMKNQPMPNCPLAIEGANVNVVSAGNGYWVQISSTDQATAEEVLRRAEQLVR